MIGTDVGALGEDAAAQAREDRNQRCAESQADQRLEQVVQRDTALPARQIPVEQRHAEQAQANHQHAGDRATLERDVERFVHALGRRLRGTYVSANRHTHADEAACSGQNRAQQKAECSRQAQSRREHHDDEQYRAYHCDGAILSGQIGSRTHLNRCSDFLHAAVAGVLFQDPAA
jgi:hypothetical protein